MPRTTTVAVAKIIEVDEDIDLDPFIEAANMLVTTLCAPEGLSDTQLEIIERWLSAHFYAIRVPRSEFEKISTASEKHPSKVDLGLRLTWYGQQAIILDTSGALGDWDLEASSTTGASKVQLLWGGTECPPSPSENECCP